MAELFERKRDFLDEVEELTNTRNLTNSREFISDLLPCKRANRQQQIDALLGQVRIAREGKAMVWLKTVAKEAMSLDFHTRDWIRDNIFDIGKGKRRKPSSETPTVSKDYRRDLDPTISVVVADEGRLASSSTKEVEEPPSASDSSIPKEATKEVEETPKTDTDDVLSLGSSEESHLLDLEDETPTQIPQCIWKSLGATTNVPADTERAQFASLFEQNEPNLVPMEVDMPSQSSSNRERKGVEEESRQEGRPTAQSRSHPRSPVRMRISSVEESRSHHRSPVRFPSPQKQRSPRRSQSWKSDKRQRVEGPYAGKARGRGMMVDLPEKDVGRQAWKDQPVVSGRESKTSTLTSKSSERRDTYRGQPKEQRPEKIKQTATKSVNPPRRESKTSTKGNFIVTVTDQGKKVLRRKEMEVSQGTSIQKRQEGGKGVTSQNKWMPCLVPTCNESNVNPKAHAFTYHVPKVFEEEQDVAEVSCRRVAALKLMNGWLLGNRAKLEDLLTYVNSTEQLPPDVNREVSERDVTSMVGVSRELLLEPPEKFTISPINSPAGLVHWRSLMVIIAKLEPRHQLSLWNQFGDVPLRSPSVSQVMPALEMVPEGFDSHFHLDRLRSSMDLRSSSLDEICGVVGKPEPAWRVKLVGSVANFCDPASYPTPEEVRDLRAQGIRVSIGLHPKETVHVTAEDLQRMKVLLEMPEVVGLGEVGIDHSVPPARWAGQQRVLSQALALLQERHVLVIHCRSMDNTDSTGEAYTSLLFQLKGQVPPFQPIHLHCFTGTEEMVAEWLSVFPNTYFGYTRLVNRFQDIQLKGLQAVSDDRFLLETDAPYFPFTRNVERPEDPVHHSRRSAPSLIGLTAGIIAHRRDAEVLDILRITTANARKLYGGSEVTHF